MFEATRMGKCDLCDEFNGLDDDFICAACNDSIDAQDQRTMNANPLKIKMSWTARGALDLSTVKQFMKGEVYTVGVDIGDDQARAFIRKGCAEVVNEKPSIGQQLFEANKASNPLELMGNLNRIERAYWPPAVSGSHNRVAFACGGSAQEREFE